MSTDCKLCAANENYDENDDESSRSESGDETSGDDETSGNEYASETERECSSVNESENEESQEENGYPKEINEFLAKEASERVKRDSAHNENNSGNEEESASGQPAMATWGSDEHHGHHGRRTHYRLRMSSVVMPSGQSYNITMPRIRYGWKCGDKTTFINLSPKGRMGKTEYTIVSKEMEATRKTHTSGAYSGYEIIKIEKISNACLWKKYRFRRRRIIEENGGDANERMLWHGSSVVKEIAKVGFDERYSSQTGMFGAGVYFAENSSKSNQYAWGLGGSCKLHTKRHCFLCERQLLLCRVALGKVMEYTKAQQQLAHAPPGYHSVKGLVSPGGLQYTENVVYRGEQVYPEYLITYKIKP